MDNETKIEIDHIGKTIAKVADGIEKDSAFGITEGAAGGVDGSDILDGTAGISLASVDASQETDDFKFNASAGISAGYNPFDNEFKGRIDGYVGIEENYGDGLLRTGVNAGYDTSDGFQAGAYAGYTEHDPSQRIHTWQPDAYISLDSSGNLEGAIRGEAQMEVYKDSDGRLLNVYGQAALGAHTEYGAGASVEVGLERDVNIPYFGDVTLRGGVGYNTSENNYNDRSRIDRAKLDVNTGSNNEGVYGKIGVSLKF